MMRALLLAAALAALPCAAMAQGNESVDDMLRNMHPRDVHAPVQNSAACREAEIGIRWVLLEDQGARGTYEGGRRSGMSALDAVIWAQHHNPHQQEMIRECPTSWQMIAKIIGEGAMGGANPRGPGEDTPSPDDLDKMITEWEEPFSGNSVLVVLENRGDRNLWLEVIVNPCQNLPSASCGEIYSGLLVHAHMRESFVVPAFPDFDHPPSFGVKWVARLRP